MKNLSFIFTIILLATIACKKDEPVTPQSLLSNASMTATIDGIKWTSLTRVTIQKNGLFLITGTSSDGKVLEVTVKGIINGTYNFEASMDSVAAQCGSIYKPSLNNNDSTFVSNSGQVIISNVDTENKQISGTFHFVVTNLNVTKNITEGKFTDLKYLIQ